MTFPVTGAMTIQDTGSASHTGAGSIAYFDGTPTPGSVAVRPTGGLPSAGIQLSGTWTGSVDFETSMDGGATWRATGALPVGSDTAAATAVTANTAVTINTIGCTHVRARCTAAMTGSVSVYINPSAGVAP